MEQLNIYLKELLSTQSRELRLEPNKIPYLNGADGTVTLTQTPILGTQISLLVFPLIPMEVKLVLPDKPEIEFTHKEAAGEFKFLVKKTPAGFDVTIRPATEFAAAPIDNAPAFQKPAAPPDFAAVAPKMSLPEIEPPEYPFSNPVPKPLTNAPPTKSEPFKVPPPVRTHYEVGALQAVEAVVYAEPPPIVKNETPLPKPPEISSASPVFSAPSPEKPPTSAAAKVNSRAQGRMDKMFYKMSEFGASDLHLSTGMPPLVRKDGKMQTLETDETMLDAGAMKEILTSIMPAKNQEEFDVRHDTDFAYQIEGLARFRANIFMDRKGMGGVFRVIPAKITTAEQLGLSKAILDLCNLSKGLVVVTGPTGSGKSTTLCSMIDYINERREDHIITIEDPIEFTHENKKCLVNQREVHNHTDSFKDALRAALREDPDIILVGEMRDLETIAIAIETAETGHLVFGTLHTSTAASTVDRIIDQFPADRQQQIRVMLSESLKGVISQTLLPKKGGGRVAALEVLIVTPAISNLIREGKTFQIPSAMQTGKQHGMIMLNDALMELVQKGVVEPRDAYIKAVEKNGFEALLNRNGFKL